ncbi:nucleoside deaminase [Flavobacteriaceae bacterium R38]|nr:nucleoside deaminase [Flavobacteriaceae bacterium R38]
MNKCIELARIAKERGDSPVGSILVKNNTIVGEGIEGGKTFKDITYHSEIEAIRDATKSLNTSDLSDCILFSTHEPCIMCSYAIRHHKINTIVFAIPVNDVGGYSSKFKVLEDLSVKKWGSTPKIIKGILEKECLALHE